MDKHTFFNVGDYFLIGTYGRRDIKVIYTEKRSYSYNEIQEMANKTVMHCAI